MILVKKIVNNIAANYILKTIQMFLYLVAVPILIQGVGIEGFALIIFASTLVGYFSILDFGISQGVSKYGAQYLANNDEMSVSKVLNTSIGLFFIIGFLVFGVVIVGIEFDILKYFNISSENYEPAREMFIVAAFLAIISWPRLALEGGFRGIQDFPTLNFTIGVGRILSTTLAILAIEYFQASIVYVFVLFNLDKFFFANLAVLASQKKVVVLEI